MTPTKKQIAEVTNAANESGTDVEKALRYLKACSLSIYKVIGAIGVCKAVNNEYSIIENQIEKSTANYRAGKFGASKI